MSTVRQMQLLVQVMWLKVSGGMIRFVLAGYQHFYNNRPWLGLLHENKTRPTRISHPERAIKILN